MRKTLDTTGSGRLDGNALQMNGAYQALFGVAPTLLAVGADYQAVSINKLGVVTSSLQATLHASGSMVVSTTEQITMPTLYVGTNGTWVK